MLIAENASQYVVPATSVLIGCQCSLCKKVINVDSPSSLHFDSEADSLVLTNSVEAEGNTIISYSHISCIQALVNVVPSVYMEYEDLRESYLRAAV